MKINDFSLTVEPGRELDGGHVEMDHDTKYDIVMRNTGNRRCDVDVSVDGKSVGGFRLSSNGTLRLERPVDDTGHFTFYREGSKKGKKAGLDNISSDDMGRITVTFRPERERPQHVNTTNLPVCDSVDSEEKTSGGIMRGMGGQSMSMVGPSHQSAGGTGLSGVSSQSFYTVAELEHDEQRTVTINLRLVCGKGKNEPRPLESRSNPVPNPVHSNPV